MEQSQKEVDRPPFVFLLDESDSSMSDGTCAFQLGAIKDELEGLELPKDFEFAGGAASAKRSPARRHKSPSPTAVVSKGPRSFVPKVLPDETSKEKRRTEMGARGDENLPTWREFRHSLGKLSTATPPANNEGTVSSGSSFYTGESLLDKMPTEVLHVILFLLEDVKLRIDSEFLDASVSISKEARKISRSMMNFMLSCKRVWQACMKRGGLPSSRPLFCIMTFAKRGDHARLAEMLQVIGEPARRLTLLNEALLLCTSTITGTVSTARLLLEQGADPDCQNISGAPIHFAARRSNLEMLELLSSFGAKNQKCPLGFSPADWADNAGNFELAHRLRQMGWG